MRRRLLIFSLAFWIQSQGIVGETLVDETENENVGFASNCESTFSDKVRDVREHPWLAIIAIKDQDRYICGGTIISEHSILTAAHCLKTFNASDLYILAGSRNISDTPQRFQVKRITSHIKYSGDHYRNDIGLVEIKGSFEFSTRPDIKPICVATTSADYSEGRKCIVAEWIAKEGSVKSFDFKQRYSDVVLISKDNCKTKFEKYDMNFINISRGMFCADKTKNVEFYNPTSGCPLICEDKGRYVMYGITFAGVKESKFPNLYTDVSKYKKWIQKYNT